MENTFVAYTGVITNFNKSTWRAHTSSTVQQFLDPDGELDHLKKYNHLFLGSLWTTLNISSKPINFPIYFANGQANKQTTTVPLFNLHINSQTGSHVICPNYILQVNSQSDNDITSIYFANKPPTS